jgi:hypothetical protein
MKPALLIPIALLAGLAVGGGAAIGVGRFAPSGPEPEAPAPIDTEFVATGPILTPLVFPDGRFAGYVAVEAQLEVAIGEAEGVRLRMPLLLHAINLRTFRTPLATGPDGQIPDIAAYRRILIEAAPKVFGAGMVRRVAITQARPA